MALKNTFSGLDYWRLADEISVVDASFLTIGLEPGNYRLSAPDYPLTSNITKDGGYGSDDETFKDPDGFVYLAPAHFRAVFKALRNAILSDKLKAKIVNLGREPDYGGGYNGHSYRIPPDGDEEERHYGFAVSRGIPTVYSNADSIYDTNRPGEDRVIYVLKEPDWSQTTIEVEDLKRWFNSRGVAPAFFFPEGIADGFRDKQHPRYSPKLATAVAAWETVKRPAKNKSAKATLTDWITGNGVRFNLSNEDGVVSPTVAEEVAKIANWNTGGGANPTNPELEEADPETTDEIQNFQEVPPTTPKNPYYGEKVDDTDDGIPF